MVWVLCKENSSIGDTAQIHSRYGGNLSQTKRQYNQTSQVAEPVSFTEVLKDSHIPKAHPKRGLRGAAQLSKAAGSSVSWRVSFLVPTLL